MTSKEALSKLKEHFKNDNYKEEREMLNIIDKYQVVLEILKKYIYISEKDKSIKMATIVKQWENFHFEILKEWLEE